MQTQSWARCSLFLSGYVNHLLHPWEALLWFAFAMSCRTTAPSCPSAAPERQHPCRPPPQPSWAREGAGAQEQQTDLGWYISSRMSQHHKELFLACGWDAWCPLLQNGVVSAVWTCVSTHFMSRYVDLTPERQHRGQESRLGRYSLAVWCSTSSLTFLCFRTINCEIGTILTLTSYGCYKNLMT